MDLKNLISRTSDDDDQFPPPPPAVANPSPKAPISRGSSQPRLSIHSLMNDSDDVNSGGNVGASNNTSFRSKENSIDESQIKTDYKENNEKEIPPSSLIPKSEEKKPEDDYDDADIHSIIPQPSASYSSFNDGPTMDQRAVPFLPTDENGIMLATVQKTEEENLREEPKFHIQNTTESKEEELAIEKQKKNDDEHIKSQNSINAVTNHTGVEKSHKMPPLPETQLPHHETKPLFFNDKVHDIIGKEDKNGIKEMKHLKHESQKKIHDQIQKLEDLKKKEEIIEPSKSENTEGKPKRYKTKPTWAQDYIPSINQAAVIANPTNMHGFKNDISNKNISKLSIPSITGSIPRNDFNKLVTEWIWANVEGVRQDYLDVPNIDDYIEIECKLGNIWDKVKDRRIQLPVNTECVVATDYVTQECFFKPGITLQNYNDTKAYISKLIQETTEQQQQGKGDSSNKFIIENSHVVDLIASDSRRMDKPISGRVSLDIKTKRKTNSISKQRISDLYLHFPNTLFDLRLSLSVELPKELNDAAFEVFKKRVTLEREKERISYIHHATFTRIDLTKVREKNNRIPKYELELEINTPALLESMRTVMEDPLYYIDLVQAFLDNGRIITRHLSQVRQ